MMAEITKDGIGWGVGGSCTAGEKDRDGGTGGVGRGWVMWGSEAFTDQGDVSYVYDMSFIEGYTIVVH